MGREAEEEKSHLTAGFDRLPAGFCMTCLTSLWLVYKANESLGAVAKVVSVTVGSLGNAKSYSSRKGQQASLPFLTPTLCLSAVLCIPANVTKLLPHPLLISVQPSWLHWILLKWIKVYQKREGKGAQNSSRWPKYTLAFLKYWSVTEESHSSFLLRTSYSNSLLSLLTTFPTPCSSMPWVRTCLDLFSQSKDI